MLIGLAILQLSTDKYSLSLFTISLLVRITCKYVSKNKSLLTVGIVSQICLGALDTGTISRIFSSISKLPESKPISLRIGKASAANVANSCINVLLTASLSFIFWRLSVSKNGA